MNRKLLFLIGVWLSTQFVFGQAPPYLQKIDSLIVAESQKPFSGVVLISQEGNLLFSKVYGFADLAKKEPLMADHQFVIGSISKQIAAVLVLQQYEKGKLSLHLPIRTYLPELQQSWADTVTIHQLLTHTHGITALDQPLAFKAGTQFLYSQLGYELLAKILEKTTGTSFASLSMHLFKKCKMKGSFHPALNEHRKLADGITELPDGSIIKDPESLQNYVAAGSFISTAQDLIRWNELLHGGKLLKKSTYNLMLTKQEGASRDHPIFGKTEYGYGITIDSRSTNSKVGLTGFAPGFVSMNYYFPESNTSVVVLSNLAWDYNNFKNTFFYYIEILKIMHESDLAGKTFARKLK